MKMIRILYLVIIIFIDFINRTILHRHVNIMLKQNKENKDTGIKGSKAAVDIDQLEYEPCHEKTNILHMRKQKRRSASR